MADAIFMSAQHVSAVIGRTTELFLEGPQAEKQRMPRARI